MSGGRWTRGPLNECIEVSPVYFFYGQKGSSISSEVVGSSDDNNDDDGKHSVMAVNFWSCDDRYGSPRVGDLQSKLVQSTTSSKVDSNPADGQRHKALPYGCRTGRILNLQYATINGVVDT